MKTSTFTEELPAFFYLEGLPSLLCEGHDRCFTRPCNISPNLLKQGMSDKKIAQCFLFTVLRISRQAFCFIGTIVRQTTVVIYFTSINGMAVTSTSPSLASALSACADHLITNPSRSVLSNLLVS